MSDNDSESKSGKLPEDDFSHIEQAMGKLKLLPAKDTPHTAAEKIVTLHSSPALKTIAEKVVALENALEEAPEKSVHEISSLDRINSHLTKAKHDFDDTQNFLTTSKSIIPQSPTTKALFEQETKNQQEKNLHRNFYQIGISARVMASKSENEEIKTLAQDLVDTIEAVKPQQRSR